jgi:DNA (cytosine-5)-methyltransferase 1
MTTVDFAAHAAETTARPRLLDLFCKQGGVSMGYHLAGFDVVGVDIEAQPRYPFEFHQADALEFLAAHWAEFDGVLASPPCQRYSKTQRIQGREHPDLIGPTRDLLDSTGLPYVIENVEEARGELVAPVMLCGAMFGLATYRHRLFEAGGGFSFTAPAHPQHTARNAKMGRPVRDGEFMHVVGNFSDVPRARRVMGMSWASRDGLREAVPPAYAEYIGRHLLASVALAVTR